MTVAQLWKLYLWHRSDFITVFLWFRQTINILTHCCRALIKCLPYYNANGSKNWTFRDLLCFKQGVWLGALTAWGWIWYVSFRPTSIVQGDKHVVQPIIEWLLRNKQKLKERAYLANYLVRINVPPDFLADAKISELNEEVTDHIRFNVVYIWDF